MKIAYLLSSNEIEISSGVHQKIQNQKRLWEKQGNVVKLFYMKPRTRQSTKCIKKYIELQSAAKNISVKILKFKPNILYARYLIYVPAISSLLKQVPTVFEINSDDIAECWLRGPLRGSFNVLTRDYVLGQSSGMIFVTKELQNKKSFSKFHKESSVITNGAQLPNSIEY